MTQRLAADANVPSVAISHSNSYPTCLHPHTNSPKERESNVFHLLAWREVSPSVKRSARKLWGHAVRKEANCFRERCEITDAKQHLISWVEAESLRHLSAKYCPLVPPPRSTIAAAFSPDGKTLASTHGDHTVKIIDCHSGSCLKVLSGHRRTPWVVRFHPGCPEILASGSLDHEVRLWDANSAECIGSRDFHRPIASIAFHAQGDLLAVASGHKLYIWQYNKKGESSPSIVLRTRRSLRAVHFHPHAAPFLLTAEVNELNVNGPDSQMTVAMSPGYMRYPPPAVLFANVHSGSGHNSDAAVTSHTSFASFPCLLWPASLIRENLWLSAHQDNMVIDSISGSLVGESSPHIPEDTNARENEHVAVPMDIASLVSSSSCLHERVSNHMSGAEGSCADSAVDTNVIVDNISPSATDMKVTVDNMSPSAMDVKVTVDNMSSFGPNMKVTVDKASSSATDTKVVVDNMTSSVVDSRVTVDKASSSAITQPSHLPDRESGVTATTNHPASAPGSMNLRMLLTHTTVGQLNQFLPLGDPSSWDLPFLQGWLMGQSHAGTHLESQNMEVTASSPVPRGATRAHSRHRQHSRLMGHGGSGDAPVTSSPNEEAIPRNSVGSLVPDFVAAPASFSAAASAAAAAAELPCTVRLRLWPHDINSPCAQLDPGSCRLSIPHAVLCSEMGAHFSPCGRLLAVCVACVLPPSEQMHQDYGASTSPTRHPATAHHVVYELRIYSLENATFGEVLASRAIRAAHCLTSIQFSPSSEHILLAYGRRHNSLLRSIIIDGECTTPIYTILEVYKVLDMELVRVLPSGEDEVNVACFHPIPGFGIVYGTKEGKLRILQYDSSHNENCMDPELSSDESMLEVQTYAMEC